MIAAAGMETLAARLHSFNVAHQVTKKRTSNAKNAGKVKWPHKSPDAGSLASAGFFYNPKASAPDNTTCYLCNVHLDGWEKDDDPIKEHLSLSESCGWAAIVSIERDIIRGSPVQDDPMDERLLEARRATFTNWPHENKRGWICKTQKMIEAGWYYCPTPESDDYARCSYCSLGLDGWEPKDNPFDEHKRRSSDCAFFAFSATTHKKAGRGRKSRTSKASRLSTQSNITTLSENMSMMDVNGNGIKSPQDNTEITIESKGTKTTKKGGRSKKAAPKSKRKVSTAQQDEMVVGSSFDQTEDDFEVEADPKPVNAKGNNKRKSDSMDIDSDLSTIQVQPPPSKRRATRSSISRGTRAPISTLEFGLGEGPSVVEFLPNSSSPPPPISKKAQKGGRKRASTTTRKASAASTASKASLRATVPEDEDIDAALEADLNRPLTDDEVNPDPPPAPKAKGRRLTRTRPGSRNATASTAPVRRATRASTMPCDRDQCRHYNKRPNASIYGRGKSG
ncbi:MAG: hypothetical protein Q9183_005812 [Haloplaca sp. 2 TL-2023]